MRKLKDCADIYKNSPLVLAELNPGTNKCEFRLIVFIVLSISITLLLP